MANRTVLAAQLRFIFVDDFTAGEAVQDVVDGFLAGVEFGDVAPDVLVTIIAQHLKFVPIGTQNCAVGADPM